METDRDVRVMNLVVVTQIFLVVEVNEVAMAVETTGLHLADEAEAAMTGQTQMKDVEEEDAVELVVAEDETGVRTATRSARANSGH